MGQKPILSAEQMQALEQQKEAKLAMGLWSCCSDCDSSMWSWGGTVKWRKVKQDSWFEIKWKIRRILARLNCFGDGVESLGP